MALGAGFGGEFGSGRAVVRCHISLLLSTASALLCCCSLGDSPALGESASGFVLLHPPGVAELLCPLWAGTAVHWGSTTSFKSHKFPFLRVMSIQTAASGGISKPVPQN